MIKGNKAKRIKDQVEEVGTCELEALYFSANSENGEEGINLRVLIKVDCPGFWKIGI